MNYPMIIGLIQNVAILSLFSLLYDLVWAKESRFKTIPNQILLGIIIGAIGLILMYTPWEFLPGITFDTRSILLLTSGLFFGHIPTIIAMVITASYRVYTGGIGMYMGVAVILTSGTIGCLWKVYKPEWRKGNYLWDLFKVGMLTHIIMLGCTVLLPPEMILVTLKKMAIPVLVIYPLSAILLGRIMIDRMSAWKTKNSLKLSEERYKTFIDANKDCMFVKDENLRYIMINDSMCDFFRKSKEEILNKTDNELSTEDLTAPCINSDRKALGGEKMYITVEQLGDRIYEITKFPINLNKEKTGVGGIMRDVTEANKKTDLQQILLDISKISIENTDLGIFLGNVHEQIRRIIKADNIYVAIWHADENKYSFPYCVDEQQHFRDEERVSLANSLTDYVRVSGKGMLITPEIEKEIEKTYHIKKHREGPFVWIGAPLMDSSLKEVIGVLVVQNYRNSSAYNQEDLLILKIIAGFIGVFIDRLTNINNLKKAKDRAEESDRLKTAFLANISHEIRTPMNGIVGFTDILMSEITDKAHKEYISIINDCVYRLLNTLNDVIDISKIEAGSVDVHKELFDVNMVLEEIHRFYNRVNHQFDFKVSLPSSEKREINTDKTKFQQIISNLVSNAIKFTNAGVVEFGYREDNGKIIFFVKDTGLGIDGENLNKIFTRFFQVTEGRQHQRMFEGTGLGLSIVEEYVKLLGGQIWVESEPGVGTQFFFTINDVAR